MKLFWMSVVRIFGIASVLSRHAFGHAIGLCLRRIRPVRISGPERLRVIFEELGGTFIKFGQMLALQPDILSIEYCNSLFNLLDRVRPFDYADIERTFVQELGKTPHQIFDSFDERPIAAASIGQVHVARLGGRKLAVKVRRPTVEIDFAGDIRVMAATIRMIRALHIRAAYWMIEPMSEFIAWTSEELDFRREARYMHRLRENAATNPHETVPEVLWEYTTRRTLVAEFLEGETVLSYLRALEESDYAKFEKLDAGGFDSHAVAGNIIDNFLGDVFRHGMFHADLHPANLMILPDNVVGYIDFGITGTISRFSRQNLIALTLAYTRGDLVGMCDAFFRISVMENTSSGRRFQEGLQRIAGSWYETESRQRNLKKNFTLVMLDMLRLSRSTGVWPERDVIKYIRSAIAIDGLITRFAPTFNLGKYLETVCARHVQWEIRRSMFNYNALAGFAGAFGRLTNDGPSRVAGMLRKLGTNEFPARIELVSGAEANTSFSRRTFHLSAVVFLIAALMSASPQRARLGMNLFTAEAVLAVSAAGMLLRNIRELIKEE